MHWVSVLVTKKIPDKHTTLCLGARAFLPVWNTGLFSLLPPGAGAPGSPVTPAMSFLGPLQPLGCVEELLGGWTPPRLSNRPASCSPRGFLTRMNDTHV